MSQVSLEKDGYQILGREVSNNVDCFSGIRYGQASRWEYTELVDLSNETDATKFGNVAFQIRALKPEDKSSFYYKEFRENEFYTYDEDCFFLNVWKPKECDNAPVIIYIHGGMFQGGCGHERHLDGKFLAERGIVFVTVQYRLGPFGFAVFPELKDYQGRVGNYGIYDQKVAYEWVKKYISLFGGDPNNITLMGQSAGAMSVQRLICDSFIRDDVSQVIMTSGLGISDVFASPITIEEAAEFWNHIKQVSDYTAEELKKISAEELLTLVSSKMREFPKALESVSPIIDGVIINYTNEELRSKKLYAEVPYLIGTTKDDIVASELFRMASDWVEQNNENAYQFFFARNLPGDASGAFHSSELWYTLGTLEKSWRPMISWDREISYFLMDSIVEFVRKGNLCHNDIWNLSENQIVVIDDNNIQKMTRDVVEKIIKQ